jgi:hypothetical protein
MHTFMRTIMRFIAALLFLCGIPVFLFLGAGLIAVFTIGPVPEREQKVLALYACFALGGLLTASGAILWCVAKIAYPKASLEQVETDLETRSWRRDRN